MSNKSYYTFEQLYRCKEIRDLLIEAGENGIKGTDLQKAIYLNTLKAPEKALQRILNELKEFYKCEIEFTRPDGEVEYELTNKGNLEDLNLCVAKDDHKIKHLKKMLGIEKLEELSKAGIIQMQQNIDFILTANYAEPITAEYAKPILEAIEKRQNIQFDYQKLTDASPILRVVTPYLLKEFRNEWHLVALEITKDGEMWDDGWLKFYNLSKMKNVAVTDFYPYHEMEDIYAPDRFKHCYGAFVNEEEGSVERVILVFDPQFEKHFSNKPFHITEKILKPELYEFRIELQLHVGHYGTEVREYNHELLQDLASYGRQVKVIEPSHLADALKNYLQEAWEQY